MFILRILKKFFLYHLANISTLHVFNSKLIPNNYTRGWVRSGVGVGGPSGGVIRLFDYLVVKANGPICLYFFMTFFIHWKAPLTGTRSSDSN